MKTTLLVALAALAIAATVYLADSTPACALGNCSGFCSETQLNCPPGCACNFVTNNCF